MSNENMQEDVYKELPETKKTINMNMSLTIPSTVHGYSIAIEYMRDWFINTCGIKFNTVYVNGKHVLSDYRRFGIFGDKTIRKTPPIVAITPVVNYDYDRDKLDLYMGNINTLVKNFNFEESFFKDEEKNICIAFNIRELEMAFQFKVRVESKAQQLDLFRYMEIAFRNGYTQREYKSVDFHIPSPIIKNLAYHAGFEENENGDVTDIANFLKYMNAHSRFPITCKMRAVNGQREYFLRVNNVLMHINNTDKLDIDEGDLIGKLQYNFHIEMNSILRMWVPHFFVYGSEQKNKVGLSVNDINDKIGLFDIKIVDYPEQNENGWIKYLSTKYEFTDEEMKLDSVDIDLSELFNSTMMDVTVSEVIKDLQEKNIPPSTIIDIRSYSMNDNNDNKSFDWSNMVLSVSEPELHREKFIEFVIYIDQNYINNYKIERDNIKGSRLK